MSKIRKRNPFKGTEYIHIYNRGSSYTICNIHNICPFGRTTKGRTRLRSNVCIQYPSSHNDLDVPQLYRKCALRSMSRVGEFRYSMILINSIFK